MPQPKGHTGNPNGRPKGKPNKATQDMRQWLARLIDDNREQIEQDLAALEPKERLQILERFMQYTTPKMQSVAASFELERLNDEQLDSIIETITQSVKI